MLNVTDERQFILKVSGSPNVMMCSAPVVRELAVRGALYNTGQKPLPYLLAIEIIVCGFLLNQAVYASVYESCHWCMNECSRFCISPRPYTDPRSSYICYLIYGILLQKYGKGLAAQSLSRSQNVSLPSPVTSPKIQCTQRLDLSANQNRLLSAGML